MDTELLQHIVQTLRSEFPKLPEERLLESALSLYEKESQRLQNLNVYDAAQEKARRMFDPSWNNKPRKSFFDTFRP